MDILRLDLTREQATMIHGIVQLHMAEHHTPSDDPRLAASIAADVPKWKEQAELTDTLVFDQHFGVLMARICNFVDKES